MYGATKDSKKLKDSRDKLDYLYSQIPGTKGCMDHIDRSEENGGCGAWCCRTQNPQVLYVEFLNTWNFISTKWADSRIINLIERCLNKYLFPNQDRGCVFLDKSTNLCSQHETRPFNCRTYGIIPEEEFKPRYERLKIIYPDTRDQCKLVSTTNGRPVTTEDMDNWWLDLNAIELGIGVEKTLISDKPDGSYRAYQDHILIRLLGEKGMEQLSLLRQNGSKEEKERTIQNILDALALFKEKTNERKENASSKTSEDTEQ